MSNELTAKEVRALAEYEEQLQKVRKTFGGKIVKFRGEKVFVSVPGSNVEIEYNLKSTLRRIRKKERGNVSRHTTVRAKGKGSSTRKSKKRMSVAAVEMNNTKKAEIRVMENRLRALRRAEREKKKAKGEAAAAGAGGAGAGAGAGAARSPSSSKNSSAGSNNHMAGLVAGFEDMSVEDVQSEITQLEEALARMGL
jgi:hypothetical protein